MGKVSITRINNNLKESLNYSLELIDGLKSILHKNDNILIKPNLNDFESFSSPEVIESLIQLLFDNNFKKVFIAESTFGNEQITEKHFQKNGYVDLAKKYNINLINLNKSGIKEIKVKKPLALEKIEIAKDVLEATKIINIPVMKVHYATGISLCIKNLKGFLSINEKRHFHEIGLNKAIIDLNSIIKTDLNIIDCTSCMERMGPKGGDVFNLNLLITGRNIGEVDYIGSKIMGYELNEIEHINQYIKLNNIDIEEIEVVGENLEKVIRPFKKIEMANIIPESIKIFNRNACSSCVNAFLLSLRFLEIYENQKLNIFMGSGNNKHSMNDNVSVAFGNCCDINNAEITVKGCPPYPLDLNKSIGSR